MLAADGGRRNREPPWLKPHASPTPMVRYTKREATDDAQYLDWVEATVVGVEEAIKTDQPYVVKIDNWFGKRWLGFSGKALGALARRQKQRGERH